MQTATSKNITWTKFELDGTTFFKASYRQFEALVHLGPCGWELATYNVRIRSSAGKHVFADSLSGLDKVAPKALSGLAGAIGALANWREFN